MLIETFGGRYSNRQATAGAMGAVKDGRPAPGWPPIKQQTTNK